MPSSFIQLAPLLSLIVGTLALSFSIWQYLDKKSQENSLRESKINFRIGALREPEIIFKKTEVSGEVIFRQKYRCVISNRGYVDDSIVYCAIYALEEYIVVYSEPDEQTIRIISLRKALSHEKKRYEQYLENRLH